MAAAPLTGLGDLRRLESAERRRGQAAIVIDVSNVIVGAARFNQHVLMDMLVRALENGLDVRERYAAGSKARASMPEPRWATELRGSGYRVDVEVRETMGEQLTDANLQNVARAFILREGAGVEDTLVLATGDGNDSGRGSGTVQSFVSVAREALRTGMFVEIVSWSTSLSSQYQRLHRQHPDRVRVRLLDRIHRDVLADRVTKHHGPVVRPSRLDGDARSARRDAQIAVDRLLEGEPVPAAKALCPEVERVQTRLRAEADRFRATAERELQASVAVQRSVRPLQLAEIEAVANAMSDRSVSSRKALNEFHRWIKELMGKSLEHLQRSDNLEAAVGGIKSALERECRRCEAALPAYLARDQLIDAVAGRDGQYAAVITGPTGSGKSTQLPQFALEAGVVGAAPHSRLCMCEPDKHVARALSKRVAIEWLGRAPVRHDDVPIKTMDDDDDWHDASVVFASADQLLHQAAESLRGALHSGNGADFLPHFGCVVVDEAHTRVAAADALLAVLYRGAALRKDSPSPLRLLVASASIDEHDFSAYLDDCPIVGIPSSPYPVHLRYAEPDDYTSRPIPKSATPSFASSRDTLNIKHTDRSQMLLGSASPVTIATDVDTKEIMRAAVYAALLEHESLPHDEPGDILVFCPGSDEAKAAAEWCTTFRYCITQGTLSFLGEYIFYGEGRKYGIFYGEGRK